MDIDGLIPVASGAISQVSFSSLMDIDGLILSSLIYRLKVPTGIIGVGVVLAIPSAQPDIRAINNTEPAIITAIIIIYLNALLVSIFDSLRYRNY